MSLPRRRQCLAGLSLLCALVCTLASPGRAAGLTADPDRALEDYVRTPDPAYDLIPDASRSADGYTLHRLRLTSQDWRLPDGQGTTRWRHWLAVVVPESVRTDTAFLIVDGGSNDDPPPEETDEAVRVAVEVAVKTGSVAAVLYQVPNQPLQVPDREEPLAEDALVAWSWDRAMDTGDWRWAIQLPMVKSVVRAMDAVQSTALQITDDVLLKRFVLHGYSKRAAAVWLTAAVDARVRAIAPGVFDFLNFPAQAEHHFRVYGFFSPAVQAYAAARILERLRTPEGRALARVVDPYSYRARLDLPKLLILATGDQFFIPDASRFYLPDLPGETLLQAIPNVAHGLERPSVMYRARRRLIAWYATLAEDRPRPAIEWRVEEPDRLVVHSDRRSLAALHWSAWNPFARDFRLDPIRALWLPRPADRRDDRTFSASVSPPRWGWSAHLVELYFRSPVPGHPQVYTTPVLVRPDTLPFEIDQPLGDPRTLDWWRSRVRTVRSGATPVGIDPDELRGYFPIPLFGQSVDSLDRAGELLARSQDGASGAARAECLVLRLNLARTEVGWHSRTGVPERFVWEHWDQARTAYLSGDPRRAREICGAINRL